MRFLCEIKIVKLVWAVIPLVLIGIIGMQESFADSSQYLVTINKMINGTITPITYSFATVEEAQHFAQISSLQNNSIEQLIEIIRQTTVDGKIVLEKVMVPVTFSTNSDKFEKTRPPDYVPYITPKISESLQELIDSGLERIEVYISLKNSLHYPSGFAELPIEEKNIFRQKRIDQFNLLKQDLVKFLNNTDSQIVRNSESSSSLTANVTSNLILELQKRDDIFTMSIGGSHTTGSYNDDKVMSNKSSKTIRPGYMSESSSLEKISINLSPKKQLESGVIPENVICREGLELIFKPSDNSPACVTPSTAEKLIQRGWIVKELNTSSCIDIVAEREKTGIPFELPSALPNNLKLTHVEKYHFSDIVILSFSSDDCGIRTNLFDGELEVRASLRTEILDETEFENSTKTRILNLPRNDHYEFFKISGHFAWGYEPIIDSYPGRVSFIGKDVSTFYTLQGHYALNDLKIIAESFR